MWASLRSAWTGGADADKNAKQHQSVNNQSNNPEGAIQAPAKIVQRSSTMSEVKKYEITEVSLRS